MILGGMLLTLNALFPATRKITRTPEQKAALHPKLSPLSLYQFKGCPFCIKVRRALKEMDIELTLRNCESGVYREELLREGGEIQVPCLKIEESGKTRWLYESDEIISYLRKVIDQPAA
jgi:glutaredoxin